MPKKLPCYVSEVIEGIKRTLEKLDIRGAEIECIGYSQPPYLRISLDSKEAEHFGIKKSFAGPVNQVLKEFYTDLSESIRVIFIELGIKLLNHSKRGRKEKIEMPTGEVLIGTLPALFKLVVESSFIRDVIEKSITI